MLCTFCKASSLTLCISTNTGRIFFPAVQCVAAFATSYPELWSDVPETVRSKDIASWQCLIPMGIDQDPCRFTAYSHPKLYIF